MIVKKTNFKYASVDLETTGLDAEDCYILQFGIVLDDLESPVSELAKKEWYVLQRDGLYPGQAFALQMNAAILKRISEIEAGLKGGLTMKFDEFCYEDELAVRVATWLLSKGWDGKKNITFAGKNFATFDRDFLKTIDFFDTVGMKHRCIDVGSMGWNPQQDGGELPNTKKLCERLGIDSDVKHTALADALQVVNIIRTISGINPEPQQKQKIREPRIIPIGVATEIGA